MIDLHSHVLPALDDGAKDLEEALSICRAAVDDGTTVLAGTPHVRFDYPTTREAMESRLEAVRVAVAANGIPLEVVGGGEIALDQMPRGVDELRGFGLAGNPDYLLVEAPQFGWPGHLIPALRVLRRSGIVPVLAHPERNHAVQQAPERVGEAVEAGALVQVTAAAVDGRFGRREQSTARALIRGRRAHLIASDGHAPSIRKIGMSAACEAVGDDELAHWLAVGVPGAIVSGAPLPKRPASPRLPFRRIMHQG